MDHLRPSGEFSPILPTIEEYATPAYVDLIHEVGQALVPNHEIVYVPFKETQAGSAPELTYATPSQLDSTLRDADVIVCISRDEDLIPAHTDPEYNITLPPSALSNVDTAVDLFKRARSQGNSDIRFIATGRMHNRAIRAMLALPIVAEHIKLNAEDLYHVSEARFRQLLESGLTRDSIAELQLNSSNPELEASYKALMALLKDPKDNTSLPTAESSEEDPSKVVEAIWQEYRSYPRISTSRLMLERAAHYGIPLEALYEEDGAVDTITNLLNVADMLAEADDFKDFEAQTVVIVAGSDHLPRIMWIADHILPNGIKIICVESDPALTSEAYNASCLRERNSFRKGYTWISGTRDLKELTKITERGYFGVDRTDTAELARYVAAQAAGTTALNQV